MRSLLLSLAAIVVCGGAGSAAGWAAARAFGLRGIAGALVALPIAMLVATALWAAAIAARNRWRRRPREAAVRPASGDR